mmetsp:Transcript_23684/g.66490  ORF Transcript_23684/g.66490 Transcript_23684/m.66490 type:complete len:231 (-) Transcript_23684:83-775(-)
MRRPTARRAPPPWGTPPTNARHATPGVGALLAPPPARSAQLAGGRANLGPQSVLLAPPADGVLCEASGPRAPARAARPASTAAGRGRRRRGPAAPAWRGSGAARRAPRRRAHASSARAGRGDTRPAPRRRRTASASNVPSLRARRRRRQELQQRPVPAVRSGMLPWRSTTSATRASPTRTGAGSSRCSPGASRRRATSTPIPSGTWTGTLGLSLFREGQILPSPAPRLRR